MSKPIVYVVQEPLKRNPDGSITPRIPLHTLERYGTLCYLFSWGEVRDDEDFDQARTAELMDKAREKLEGYSQRDFIAPLGNPALIAMSIIAAYQAHEDRIVNVLDWKRNESRYRIVTIDAL